jgi:hypothetical protein
MIYIIFTAQIFLFIYSLLENFIHTSKYGIVLVFVLVVVFILVGFLLTKFELSKNIVLIAGFVLDVFLVKYSLFANVLSFASLYFYILDKLKENDVLKKSMYFYLSPLILLGFIPLKLPGALEKVVKNFFSKILLASPGGGSGISQGNRTQLHLSNFFGNLKNSLYEDFAIDNFQIFNLTSLLLSIVILVVLLVIFYLILRSQTPKNKKISSTRYKIEMFLLSFLFAILEFVVIYTFFGRVNEATRRTPSFNFLSLVELALLYGLIFFAARFVYKRENVTFRIPYNVKADAISLLFFFGLPFTLLFLAFYKGQNRDMLVSIFIIGLSILGVLFLEHNINLLNGVNDIDRILKNDTSKFKENYLKFQAGYLDKITDRKEFIEYLYFLCILKFLRKGFSIEDYSTPNEILREVLPYLTTEKFEILTNALYTVEFSNQTIPENKFAYIRNFTKELLNEIDKIGELKKKDVEIQL